MITLSFPTTINEVPKTFSKHIIHNRKFDYTNINGQWYISEGSDLISDFISDKDVLRAYAKSLIEEHFPE